MAPERAIRLIALDLDGTLLNPNNTVSDTDARAVRDAVAAGVTVVFATSRWHEAARRTAISLALDGFIISHNGALVRTCDGERDLLHLRIEAGLARHLAAHIDEVDGDAYMTVDDLTFVRGRRPRNAARLPADMALCGSLVESLDRLGGAATEPTAFLLFGREGVRSTVERFRAHHGVSVNLAEGVSEAFPDYLNIVHPAADKGSGMRAVCADLGISMAETLAVGDAAPDIAMIKLAGIGVAMGNGAPDVKAAAAAVAPSNSEGGVAWAIRRFVLGES